MSLPLITNRTDSLTSELHFQIPAIKSAQPRRRSEIGRGGGTNPRPAYQQGTAAPREAGTVTGRAFPRQLFSRSSISFPLRLLLQDSRVDSPPGEGVRGSISTTNAAGETSSCPRSWMRRERERERSEDAGGGAQAVSKLRYYATFPLPAEEDDELEFIYFTKYYYFQRPIIRIITIYYFLDPL